MWLFGDFIPKMCGFCALDPDSARVFPKRNTLLKEPAVIIQELSKGATKTLTITSSTFSPWNNMGRESLWHVCPCQLSRAGPRSLLPRHLDTCTCSFNPLNTAWLWLKYFQYFTISTNHILTFTICCLLSVCVDYIVCKTKLWIG